MNQKVEFYGNNELLKQGYYRQTQRITKTFINKRNYFDAEMINNDDKTCSLQNLHVVLLEAFKQELGLCVNVSNSNVT